MKINKWIIGICIIFCFNYLVAQEQKNIVELRQLFKTAKHDTTKANIYISLAKEYLDSSTDSVEKYSKLSLSLSIRANYEKGLANSHMILGVNNYNKSQYDSALLHYNFALHIFQSSKDSTGLGKLFNLFGNLYLDMGKPILALENYEKCMEIKRLLNNKKDIAETLMNIGVFYETQGSYTKALEVYQKALLISEQLNDNKRISDLYNNVGGLHFTLNNFDKALEYYQKALKITKELNDLNLLYGRLNNVGLVYENKKEFKKAIAYFEEAQKICEQTNDKTGLSITLVNLGLAYHDSKQYETAIQYYKTALSNFKEIGMTLGEIKCLNSLAASYIKNQNFQQAVLSANEAVNLAIEVNSKDDQSEAYKNLSEAYENQRNYKDAFLYYRLHKTLNDSIFSTENAKKTTALEMQYGFDKQQEQLHIEQAKKDVEQKSKLERQQMMTIFFIIGFLLMSALAYFVFRNYKEKKQANIVLQEQKNEILEQNYEIQSQNEEINSQLNVITHQSKEITDSILSAKRIQTAMLPPTSILDEINSDYFILFMPRDIVSGDFYWFKRIKNLLYITVADCTGHGVPGAFTSMLGMSLLNEIVTKRDIMQANTVLYELRKRIKASFHQTGEKSDTKDGMDMALCIIDLEMYEMQYAGANNQLLIARNGELIEYKADRMPIGVHPKENEMFTNNEIIVQKADAIYIYSDGYEDQFHGETGKKFLAKNFKKLITSIQMQPMAEQKEVLAKAMIDWKLDYWQVDDITVLGFRIV